MTETAQKHVEKTWAIKLMRPRRDELRLDYIFATKQAAIEHTHHFFGTEAHVVRVEIREL